MITNIRVALIFMIVVLITILLFPIQYIAVKLGLGLSRKIPVIWHRMVLKLIGIRVHVAGKLVEDRPLLIVSNHISWTDILVLGSIDEMSFIAKHEVDKLPGANLLARMQRTIFVIRENKREVAKQAREVTNRLISGDPIVLFPEGTTGNGNRVLEFKSSLFGATHYALNDGGIEKVYVQPVSIAYTKLHGMPIGRIGRTLCAWTGDMDLGPHINTILRNPSWDIEVRIGEPMEIDKNTRRREIASVTRNRIRGMYVEASFGRASLSIKEKQTVSFFRKSR
ncbi:MAG: lysophospholipid acyltransferase family protein [Rhizobiaceae bacterium]